MSRPASVSILVGLVLSLASCSSPTTPGCTTNCGGGGGGGGGGGAGSGVLVGAGDIAVCGSLASVATGDLVDAIDGTVFTAGDNAYPNGKMQDFQQCYAPAWGRHKSRTRPTPGNHDYETPGAADYFAYFGDLAGSPGEPFYAYSIGPWKVYALNSEIGVSTGSAQYNWLRAELTTRGASCALAIWHKPLFTSGPNGPNANMRDIYKLLYDNNAEVIINGHDHLYERFAPQDADGRRDEARGLRQFIIGTGGVPLYDFSAIRPNSEVRNNKDWGVLKLTLSAGAYQWEFIAVGGGSRDSGTGTCH